jgi:hypothetical protein
MPVSIPSDGFRSRMLLWIAHQAAGIWVGLAALDVAGYLLHGPVRPALGMIVPLGLMSLLFAEHYHGVVMCPLCAAAVALDGARQAERRTGTLRLAHRMYSAAYQVVDIALCAAVLIGLLVLSAQGNSSDLALTLVTVAMFASTAIEAYVLGVHRPLQPWCPQCNWDEGGDEEAIPDPVPPSGVKAPT